VTLVEHWLIVEPRLDLFKLAVNVGLHDVRAAWPTFSIAAHVLPPANVHKDGEWRPPADAILFLAGESDAFVGQLMKLNAWVSDFQGVMQTQLLGDLFCHKVPPREPLDPAMFAIRLDQYDELKRRLNDSPWGREAQATNERVRKALESGNEP
jgi:hypothetical protein